MISIEKRNAARDKNGQFIFKNLAFVRTAELGSFTKAAEDLHYAQSSVSKMIADLEKEWNVLLLERDRSSVCLTSEGQRILPLAREILNDHRRHTDTIGRMKGMETGIVRIGTFASVAIHWLPNIFAHFRKDFPGIEYEILLGDYDEIEKQIEDGRVDCGFLRFPTEPSWGTLLLKEDEYKVVLPQNHPLAAAESIPIEKPEGQPFLLLEHGGKTDVSELLEKYGVRPSVCFTTWEDFAIMAMAEKGLGIGILPSLILQRIPYDIEVRPPEKPFYRKIGLACKNKNRLLPATRKFTEYLCFREEEKGRKEKNSEENLWN